jgi:hypothetical protein
MAYAFLAISLALAVAFLAVGLSRHMPPSVTTDAANAQERCCWAPQGKETRCFPCRPTRDTR